MCPIKYCTEDAINKAAGGIAPEELGQFYCFINGSLCWYRIIKQNLVDCKSEYIFVDSGHLLQRPFTGSALDVRIDLGKVITNTLDQFARVLHHSGLQVAVVGMSLQDLGRDVLSRIVFVECLQGDHARLPAYPYWHTSLVPVYACLLGLGAVIDCSIALPFTRWLSSALYDILNVDIDDIDLHTDHVFEGLGDLLLDKAADLDNIHAGLDDNIQIG